jgi:anti-sigma regulatory factor (Ser/Thr protein kinase)
MNDLTATPLRSLELRPEATSVRLARAFVATALREWTLDGLGEVAVLLTSELVTNAVLHTRGAITVSVELVSQRRVVRVGVQDQSTVVPRRRNYSPLATTGRGLIMVVTAADAFGVDPLFHGKVVWFEIAIPAPSPHSQDR